MLKENIIKTLIGMHKDFSAKDSAQEIVSRIDTWDYMKLKSFFRV